MWGALIGLATTVAGGLLKKKESSKQADVSTQNAEAMQKEADYQRFRTSVQLKRNSQYLSSLLGAQRAAYAKSGIQVDTGTAMQVAESSVEESVEDAMLILQEGEFNVQRALSGVNMYQQQAHDISRAGTIQMGTTILTGAWDFVKSLSGGK